MIRPGIVLDDTVTITTTDGTVCECWRVVAVDGNHLTLDREWKPLGEDGRVVTTLTDEFLAAAERRALESDDFYQEEQFLWFGPRDVLTLVAEVRRLAAEVRRLRESAETARGEKP